MITLKATGDFKRTTNFLEKLRRRDIYSSLEKYGQLGVEALAAATPVNTGTTASSWTYKVEKTETGAAIYWSNSNINKGVNIE